MRIIAFDFQQKKEEEVSQDAFFKGEALPANLFYWITFDPGEQELGRRVLQRLGTPETSAEALLGPQTEGRFDLLDHGIHFSITEAWYHSGTLHSGITEFLLSSQYLAVMPSGPSPALEQIHKIYREDFHKFAKSSGFLLYELASRLLDTSRKTFQQFSAEVERIQLTLFGQVTDEIFMAVAKLTADILTFRRMVLSSRDLFNELATRKSVFVKETTQPMLGIHSDRLERLGAELDSERNVLTETLNLYMGMVSHRTNRIVNRLTIFSMIFLPLSFMCGVYGMNFEVMPELRWAYSYGVFWIIITIFVVSFTWFIKKKKWI